MVVDHDEEGERGLAGGEETLGKGPFDHAALESVQTDELGTHRLQEGQERLAVLGVAVGHVQRVLDTLLGELGRVADVHQVDLSAGVEQVMDRDAEVQLGLKSL